MFHSCGIGGISGTTKLIKAIATYMLICVTPIELESVQYIVKNIMYSHVCAYIIYTILLV